MISVWGLLVQHSSVFNVTYTQLVNFCLQAYMCMLLLGCEPSMHALEGYDTCSVSHYYNTALIAESTMVIVLTGSANSVIHSVMVDVLERCVSILSLLICLSLHFSCLFFSQGPSNCTMCTNSSLYVNRSNVIECVNRTCPVGWYDDGMKRECASYCDCVLQRQQSIVHR